MRFAIYSFNHVRMCDFADQGEAHAFLKKVNRDYTTDLYYLTTEADVEELLTTIAAVLAQPVDTNAYLRSKVSECLTNAQSLIVAGLPVPAFHHLQSAMAFAKQLGNAPEYRIMRGHIVDALQACREAF